ncbi:MAG: LamG domain-containing protein [Tepidisphaera sp.]
MTTLAVMISSLACVCGALPPSNPPTTPPSIIDQYNPVWASPSPNASGSMPIGNGTLGANVWVEPSGDLLLLLSRTDAWSETDRLLKLGQIRLRLDPNPFVGKGFRQELKLRDGVIEISDSGRSKLRVYVVPSIDQIRIEGDLAAPSKVSVALETWRTARKTFENDDELRSSWTMHSAPAEVRERLIWESPDIVRTESDRTALLWYHRNAHSVVPFTLTHQGLDPIKDQFKDPLINRTFGGLIEGVSETSFAVVKGKPSTIETTGAVQAFGVQVTTHSAQTPSPETWINDLRRISAPKPGADASLIETNAWWSAFWDRSWVFVEGDAQAASGKPIPKNKHPLRLGVDSNASNVFRGLMSRATVYRRALSSEEILRLASGGPRPDLPGGEISADFSTVLPAAEQPQTRDGWRCSSAFGPSCSWEPQGALTDERDADRWVAKFAGGHLRSLPDRSLTLDDGMTLEAIIKPAPDLGPARIFDKLTAGTSDGFLFDTHPGDSLRLIVGSLTVEARGVLKKDTWQHVAATYDPAAGFARIYLNGKLVASNLADPAEPAPPSRVTQAYILQRWIQACGAGVSRDGSRGEFPIKFNGSIFTVPPVFTEGQTHNADWRKWGGCFWWQNTRLPYYSMLASGDTEMMEPLFRFHENVLPGSKARTTLYYGAQGVYWPETITTFGTYGNGDYGWKRDGLAIGDISPCPWWQWAWNQSLELTQLMLDRAAYTGDTKFLKERALPMARETLLYFDTRFKRDDKGKLIVNPTQAAETYWHDVVNDAPVVGGLHTICDQLLALPKDIGTAEDRALWKRVKDATPAMPVWEQNGTKMAAPAEKFKNQRSNCETAELYPLWPFNQYALGKPNLDLAIAAYRARVDKAVVGWTQDGLFAAKLGLVDEARDQLLARVRNSNPKHRFPAMWGPNFDWLPDQCHGSNILTQTQLMLMQSDPVSGRILLLPTWPKDWNVSFKLHAPGQTVVECVYRSGVIEKLSVTPPARRADVVLPAGVSVK